MDKGERYRTTILFDCSPGSGKKEPGVFCTAGFLSDGLYWLIVCFIGMLRFQDA